MAEGSSAPGEAVGTAIALTGSLTGAFASAEGCGGWLGPAEEGGPSRLVANGVLPLVSAFPGSLAGNGCPEDDAGDQGMLCRELAVFAKGKPADGFVFAFRGESFDEEGAPFICQAGAVMWGEAG